MDAVTNKAFRSLTTALMAGFLAGSACLSATAHAELNIAQQPLFLTASVEPNIMFTIDDSGSMRFELTPDELVNEGGTFRYLYDESDDVYGSGGYGYSVPYDSNGIIVDPRYLAHEFNTTYYNPKIRYRPWVRADGTSFDAADEEAALHNPAAPDRGQADLTTDNEWNTGVGDTRFYFPATYYRYSGTGDITEHDNYERIEIRPGDTYTGGPERTDCGDNTDQCTYEQEIQNFANWYSFFRSRGLAARAGIGRAFSVQSGGIRVGFGAINQGWNSVDGVGTRTIRRGVRGFSGDNRAAFYEELYDPDIPASGTPLRRAARDVGEYFSRSDDRGPWSTSPGDTGDGPHLECRRSYHVLMTDGYWSGSSPDISNEDGTNGELITGPNQASYQYTAQDPFQDNFSDTLADAAMRYWKRDLRDDLTNRVPTTANNPAFWQHLTTLGVGLGVTGTINPDTAFDAIETGEAIDWPNPENSEPAKLDDLLHAAVNTRGGFFSAQDPDTFANELGSMLSSIVAEASRSATAAATNSTFAQEGARIYQARLDAESWSGNLLAFALDENTGEVLTPGNPDWTAADRLDTLNDPAASRSIYTWDGSDGIEFEWNALTAAMQVSLNNDPDLLAYLRGSDENEQSNGGDFRNRDNLIGDIVNSAPAFAGTSNFLFGRLPGGEGTEYREWRRTDAYRDRREMIYVGANDGMLHGFDAETGDERFAFVPNEVIDNLPELAEPNYSHRYYVDGSPRVIDAYINGDWRTVLVGSTGAGGRSVFALDVTDPDSFTADDVLWEFTHEELGYTIGQPTVARLDNGDWVAVFGNGYNSGSHEASVFVVNLADGSLEQHIQTGEGDADNPNGMSSVTAVDLDADRITDRFYAGDLHGNIWRMDADDGAPTNAQSMFQTPVINGERQPITVPPEVSGHPDPGSIMVFFGTGKFFEQSDNNIDDDPQTQTFYGIVDDNSTGIDRNDLLEQTITDERTEVFGGIEYPIREVSQNSYDPNLDQKGWYLDLAYNNAPRGERVLTRAMIIGQRVRFATFTPTDDPCSGGGMNWLMELDALGGSRLNDHVVDLSGDGNLDFSLGGFMAGEGPPVDGSQGGVTGDDGLIRYDLDPSSEEQSFSGDAGLDPGERGRQSWRERR